MDGMTIILTAGIVGSATLLPMKFVRDWKWENTWLLYSLLAYFVCPLAVAWHTIPSLLSVYEAAGWPVLIQVGLFGFGWGVSVVMLGLAVAAVGLAVSNGIILGCSIAIGSLVPLLILDPGHLLTADGIRIIVADVIILSGVLLCARAGYLREIIEVDEQGKKGMGKRGILLCFVAGILTPLFNLALTSGSGISDLAVAHGALPHDAANSVWGLAVSAGALPSIFYCILLLNRNRSWNSFTTSGSSRNAILCFVMAACFMAATVGYGMGALKMGRLGPVVGWPVYISSLILGNSFWGWCTGEWKGAPRSSVLIMWAGLLSQVVGIALLFAGGSSAGS